MKTKHIATIMNRQYIGENAFIFNCSHSAIGVIDEETHIFKDRNGNEYGPMLDTNLMLSEIPNAYANVIELDKLPQSVGPNLPLRDAIKEYEYLCKKVFYYVSKTSAGAPFLVTLNMDNLRNTAENSMKKQTGVSGEEESLEEEEADEEEINKDLNELNANVIRGVYSLKELKRIREDLRISFEGIETVLDTIDLQIEATEKGESQIELPEDEEESQDPKVSEEDLLSDIQDVILENGINIEDLFQKVTKTLIAQDEPARRVIAELARKEMDSRKKREGILLTGQTGVGKTELMRLIAKYLNRPFMKVDSTQLTIPGYVGKDIEEVLYDLYEKCGEDLEKTEQAIIFFDEIDKKGSSKKSDVSGQGVLNVLLPFIEGSEYNAVSDKKSGAKKIKISTKNMIVILGGAYTDVYKSLLENNGIGFTNEVSSKPRYRKATTQDFIEKGKMTDEFMGRVQVIKLNDLDVEDIRRIILESDESAMHIQEEIFKKLGVKLTFTDGYIDSISQAAFKKKTGARGINSIIDETTWRIFDEVYTHAGIYEEAILTEETLENPESFQLVKRKKDI